MDDNILYKAGRQFTSEELRRRQQRSTVALLRPVVIAAGVSDSANIGMILRICDAIACQQVIFVDVEQPQSRRIKGVSRSMNEKMAHSFISFNELNLVIGALGPLIAVEITTESNNLYDVELPQNVTFVIGNEQKGIPENVLGLCSYALHIPMLGINSSMNVATALGIVLYEWHRQMRPKIPKL
jgi:tRNA G18 (ribose-2'-O)-methylase SpoU